MHATLRTNSFSCSVTKSLSHPERLGSFCRQFVRIHLYIAHKAISYQWVLFPYCFAFEFSCSDSHLNIHKYWFRFITPMHIWCFQVLGIGQTTTGCDGFLLNRQEWRVQAEDRDGSGVGSWRYWIRWWRIPTDLGKFRKRDQGNDGNELEQYPTAYMSKSYKIWFCIQNHIL